MPKIHHDLPPALSMADLKAHDPTARWDAREVDCCCPLPACSGKTGKEHRSLGVNTETGKWICHRCNEAGKLTEYWQERPAVSLRQRRRAEAVARIAGPPPPAAPTAEDLEKRPPESEQERYAKHFPGSAGARYLEGRGIPPAVAEAHGCGYAPDLYGRPRVVFPYRDRAGELVALSGRAVADCPPGERQRHKGPKRHGVFNPAALKEGACIITEAPIDALSLIACGYPAVALGGTSAPGWLSAARVGGTTWLGTDADPPQADGSAGAGDAAAARLDKQLRYTRCPRLRPPAPHKDWNAALCAMGRETLTAWLTEALGPPPAAQDAEECRDSTRAHGPTETYSPPQKMPAAPPPRRAYSATPFGRVTEGPCSAPGYRLYSSDLLQEPFMVADVDRPEDAEPEPLIVVYTRREVALMKELPPEDVQAIHEMKRDWGGRYTGPVSTERETFMETWNRAVAEDLRLYPRSPKEPGTPPLPTLAEEPPALASGI